MASRTEGREIPSCSASTRSPGRRPPRVSRPAASSASTCARTSWWVRMAGTAVSVSGRGQTTTLRCGLTTGIRVSARAPAVLRDALRGPPTTDGPDQRRSAHAHRALHHLSRGRALPRRRARRRCGCWSGSGTRSSSPPRRRAAGRCTSTPATSPRRCRWCATTWRPSSRTRRSSRRRARASGRCATSTRWSPAGRATRSWRGGPRRSPSAPTSCPSCWSTCWASRTWAPTTRTASPTTPPATRCGCCGWATSRCGCCATSAG